MHLVEGQVAFGEEIKRQGIDAAFFESAACPPLLSPAMFRRVELPALKTIMMRMAAVLGHPAPCIIGGDTTPILDAMLETGTGYVVAPWETNQAAFMKKVWDKTEVRVRVNMDVEVIARPVGADSSRCRPSERSGPWSSQRLPGHRRLALRDAAGKRASVARICGYVLKTAIVGGASDALSNDCHTSRFYENGRRRRRGLWRSDHY